LEIRRTVVGSLPKLHGSIKDAIETAIDLQLKYGIDLISDGEQRSDMVGYFEQIPGLERRGSRLSISERIEPMVDPSGFFKIMDLKTAQKHLKKKDIENVDIKTSITGPITLGYTCAVHGEIGHYSDMRDHEIYSDLADALGPLIQELLEMGSYVQIDEPGLSANYMKPEKAVIILNKMLKSISYNSDSKEKISVHVCGDLTKTKNLVNNLLKIRVNTLSLEFSGKKENIDLISKEKLVKSRKKIGLGCISTTPEEIKEVDRVPKILQRLKNIQDKIELSNIRYIHPDCGLAATSKEVTNRILRNMKEALDIFLLKNS
jgi:5-methyltetrahydropteroyltriglutamate--homocysteine methyltransferase